VEIVLDTQLAEAVGAHFSSVFTMMVKTQMIGSPLAATTTGACGVQACRDKRHGFG